MALNLIKLAETITTQFENLTINSSSCSRITSILSSCNKCVDVCPTTISFQNSSIEVEDCLYCGLCATVCPTDAFILNSSSPKSIVDKATDLAKSYEEVYIYCSHNNKEKKITGLEVPCLGSVPWVSWLELMFIDNLKIYFPDENCTNCQLKNGFNVWQDELKSAKELINKSIPINSHIRNQIQKIGDIKLDRERRQFLSSIFGGLKATPKKLVNDWLDDNSFSGEQAKVSIETKKKTITNKRRVLMNFIQNTPHIAEQIVIKLPTILENCQFCGACSILCPNGALNHIEEKNQTIIQLNSVNCSECNLCSDICYHKAIKLENRTATEFLSPIKVLARQINKSNLNCP